jgi:hypothetical protein
MPMKRAIGSSLRGLIGLKDRTCLAARGLTPAPAFLLLGLLLYPFLPAPAAAGQDPRAPEYVSGDYLFILTSEYDYTGGGFSLMDMNPPWPHDNNYGQTCADAVARSYHGLIYVINRWGCDNIQVLDPDDDFNTVLQFSTGAGSNPQDICFVDDQRAFITRYEEADLWEVDPSTGEHTDSIDLSPLADPDGTPEMHGLAIHGDRLFVGLQRLDRDNWWLPTPPSYLAVIDLTDNSLIDMDPVAPGIQGIALASLCPNSWIVTDPLSGDLLVGQVGLYGATDGGIERIDPETCESCGFVITEEELGGDLNTWTRSGGFKGFAVVLAQDWSTKIEAFDFMTGQSLGTVTSSGEYAYTHLLVDPPRRQLFVCDRTYTNPGIRIFDTAHHGELTESPIDVGLYPYWLLGMHGPDSGVDDPDTEPGTGPLAELPRLRILPQPAMEHLAFRFDLDSPGPARLEILDVSGRRVASLLDATWPAGSHEIPWRACDAAGRALPSGTYLARLRTAEGMCTQKVHLLR